MIEAYLRVNKMFVDHNEVKSSGSSLIVTAWLF